MKTIYLQGEIIQDVTAKNFRKQFDMASKEKKRIILNSQGGSVSEGIEIFNTIQAYKGEVEIIIGVMAASITSYIAMAVPKENRKAFENSSMMVHEASASIYGRARDFKTRYDRLIGVNNIMADAYAESMGTTRDEALKMMSEDFYMTGWEALLENNMISDVVEPSQIEIPEPMENEPDFFTLLFAELEKDPDANKIRELMYSAEEKAMKDMESSKKDFEKMVALMGEIKPEQGDPDDNIKKGENMDFQDFLKSNPEAQAEYAKALKSAKADGAGDVQAQIQADRERLTKVLKLEGVKLSESAENAIIGDTPIVDYMEAKLEEQADLRNGVKKSPFSDIVVGQTPGEQDPEGAKEQAKNGAVSDDDFNAKIENYRKKRNGGKN